MLTVTVLEAQTLQRFTRETKFKFRSYYKSIEYVDKHQVGINCIKVEPRNIE